MAPQCSPCAIMTSEATQSIVRIDARIRRSSLILVIYGAIMLSLIGIMVYLLNSILSLVQQWRYMSRMARPDTSIVNTGAFAATGDNEIYRSDVENPADVRPSVGSQINAGMNELQVKYSAYNKQIRDYSNNVLKQSVPEDVFDRGVLNRVNDDFK